MYTIYLILATALLFIGLVVYLCIRLRQERKHREFLHEHYALRERIKQWEQEELDREVPREWAGSH